MNPGDIYYIRSSYSTTRFASSVVVNGNFYELYKMYFMKVLCYK